MKCFTEGECRDQVRLLPECLDDFIGEDNPVRVVDAFVDELDLRALGLNRVAPASTGRPAYHPAVIVVAILLCEGIVNLLPTPACRAHSSQYSLPVIPHLVDHPSYKHHQQPQANKLIH